MACNGRGTECERKYIPLITQNIPNQNKSHITCNPIPDNPCEPPTECQEDLAELRVHFTKSFNIM